MERRLAVILAADVVGYGVHLLAENRLPTAMARHGCSRPAPVRIALSRATFPPASKHSWRGGRSADGSKL